jgi:hypothetical protein
MDAKDRAAVLVAVSSAPVLSVKLLVSYLRLKRAANRARGRFYNGLMASGMPPREANRLADEYASAISIRNMLGEAKGPGREP